MGGFQIWQAISRFNLNQKTATGGSKDIPKGGIIAICQQKVKVTFCFTLSYSVIDYQSLSSPLPSQLSAPSQIKMERLRSRHPPKAFVKRTREVRVGFKRLSLGFRLHLTFFVPYGHQNQRHHPQSTESWVSHTVFSLQVGSCARISHMHRPPSPSIPDLLSSQAALSRWGQAGWDY